MKLRNLIVPAALVAVAGFGAMKASARSDVFVNVNISNVHDFYEPLGSCGHWVEVENYGRCWYPAYVASDWRPYANGYWLWTDGGWYWVSEEEWSWATYHYGRWAWDSYYGWVWMPGTEWGPSWVAWREGGGYIGWAPLTPACDFGPRGYVVTENIVFAPHAFVFVETRHFCEPIRPAVIINQTVVHQTIINKTVNITKIRHGDNNTVINNGPNVQVIQNTAQRDVPKSTIQELRRGKPEKFARPAEGSPKATPTREAIRENQRPTVVHGRGDGENEREKIAQPWSVKPKAVERDPTLTPQRGVVLGTPEPGAGYKHERERDRERPDDSSVRVYKGGQLPPGQAKKYIEVAPPPTASSAPQNSDQSDSGRGKKHGKDKD